MEYYLVLEEARLEMEKSKFAASALFVWFGQIISFFVEDIKTETSSLLEI